jgi:hypothetical protein
VKDPVCKHGLIMYSGAALAAGARGWRRVMDIRVVMQRRGQRGRNGEP